MITEQLKLALERRKAALKVGTTLTPKQVDDLFETLDVLIQARVREGVKFCLMQMHTPDNGRTLQHMLAEFELLKPREL